MYNQSEPNFTGPSNGAVSHLHEILRQTIADAQLLYATLDVNRSTPVLAAYRGHDIIVLLALPQAEESLSDSDIAAGIRAFLRKNHCGGVVIIYPVNIDPIGGGDETISHPEAGMLIDVQVVNQPSLKRLIPIVDRIDGENIFGPPVPLTNGVMRMEIYTDLLG